MTHAASTAQDGGARRRFFSSRWVPRPVHVSERPPDQLAAGFRAAGVACGLKPDGALDLGLLVADAPQTTSAARFTRSGVLAAPVVTCQERCDLGALRAIVANSGNANAATGRGGLDAAARMQGAGAIAAGGIGTEQVAVASTGVIGVALPAERIVNGLRTASVALAPDGGEAFAHAIRTTDVVDKHASLAVSLAAGEVVLSAQAKGAGMIAPGFATMLCFVQTDAELAAETADLLLGVCVKRSFERISVDGQLSTNDTAILQASGASGVAVAPESDDERLLGEALDALLRQLAIAMVADGEGADRIGRVHVRGGDPPACEAVAHAVADSPLVKTALNGGDPNWGRIAQAIGAALPRVGGSDLSFDIAIEGTPVCRGGVATAHDPAALAAAVRGAEVEYVIDLPGEGYETERFFSDLGHGYVTINAEYTT